MIILRLAGGVGNQLFQYALGRTLSIKNNGPLNFDTGDFNNNIRIYSLNNFNISGTIMNDGEIKDIGLPDMINKSIFGKIKRKIFRTVEYFQPLHKRKFIIEPHFNFCPDILKIKNSCYLSGVWQSEKYFNNIENIIRKEFTLKNIPTKETEEWIKKIEACDSISLHIRRGDYINNQKTNQFHGTCGLNYYEKAIKIISEKIKNPIFFIFSDDIEWAKDNLKINFPIYFVSDKIIPDYEELIIMSKCKHNIIANSSFSWWGAWLNAFQDKIVIAPKKWFNVPVDTSDLIPDSWTKI